MKRYVHICMIVSLLCAGCTRDYYRKQADKEVYGIIHDRAPDVPGMNPEFSIEQGNDEPLQGLPTREEGADFLGKDADSEAGASVLSLEKALGLAVTNSRTYQNRKELLYLQALNLTLERHVFDPIFSGRLSGDYERTSPYPNLELSDRGKFAQAYPNLVRQAGDLGGSQLGTLSQAAGFLNAADPGAMPADAVTLVNTLAGTPNQLLDAYADVVESAYTVTGANQPKQVVADERNIRGQVTLGTSVLLAGGTEIALSLTSNFLRYITGDSRVSTSSVLSAEIVQPLLRGAGRRVVMENLTQAERDVLYEIRGFSRFRKEFAVDVATSYYRVLQNRDTASNTWLGYQAFLQVLERDKARADVGRIRQADLGRTQQAALSSEARWIDAVRRYKQSLDDFKFLLGLPTSARVVLDDEELQHLMDKGIRPAVVTPDEAAEVAHAARLDLCNVRDQVEDAERKVFVAGRNLWPDFDLLVTADVESEPGDDMFTKLDWERAYVRAGFDADLPFDRKSERNAYRRSLITQQRAQREFELALDDVALAARDSWRNVDQAERTYRIQEIGVKLNERRVEEQNLRAEYGSATALDLIDAQNDLIDARNGLTSALVGHTVANLGLWLDMGILFIKDDGQWEELTDVPK
ncbi:MAG: TolC family protein [bacterium]|nr:TolC family protein [bacterium]